VTIVLTRDGKARRIRIWSAPRFTRRPKPPVWLIPRANTSLTLQRLEILDLRVRAAIRPLFARDSRSNSRPEASAGTGAGNPKDRQVSSLTLVTLPAANRVAFERGPIPWSTCTDGWVTEVPLVAPGTDLSLITLFLHADIVVAGDARPADRSVWVWAIIVDKTILHSRMRKQLDLFEKTFWSGQSLEELYRSLNGKTPQGMAAVRRRDARVEAELRGGRPFAIRPPIADRQGPRRHHRA
jgi:hypothetical protein